MPAFNLLNSLLNPPAEMVVEDTQAPQEAPATGETVVVDDVDMLKGGSRFKGVPHALNVTYTHPNLPEPLYLTVHAVLDGEFTEEDNSFGYSYGSENGTHRDISTSVEKLEWVNPTIPETADNMDLFRLTPEQVAHVSEVVKQYINTMDEGNIEKLVNIEKVVAILKPEADFNEPDDY